ncbi:hypothetical protein GLOIN_2v1471210 [Rhizophagus clarus]|uniref:Ion transport domain-containing protein n=1 Tax=Rhizophagus clarus TaxID=94130 RepID=A0A8H3LR53_9GLOM|nr:hypothetical protein GLOIN_2v1471210 [Rhizophagus clarus]
MTFPQIYKKSTSYSLNDEEKAEIDSIYSFDSKHLTSRDERQYIATSSDGTQVITLNTETLQLKLYKFDDLTQSSKINCAGFKNIDVPLEKVKWSLSISNEFTLADGSIDVLIAISHFKSDMKYEDHSDKEIGVNIDNENVINTETNLESTWIISAAQQSRIFSSINNIGGIVKFLDNKDDDSTEIILINMNGIIKYLIKHEKIREIINKKQNNDWFNFFRSNEPIEYFNFPTRFLNKLKKLSANETWSFIQRSLIKGRLVVEDYKDKVQAVEIYNLKMNFLESTFQKLDKYVLGNGPSCFSISNNETLFAYCHGANCITIYLMENGLKVATRKFKEKNIQILFFDFIQDDNKLLIVIEKVRYNNKTEEIDVTPIIVIWDLFDCSDNCIKRMNDNSSLFPIEYKYSQRLVNSSGNLIIITENGSIISLLKEPEIVKLLSSESNNMRNIIIYDRSHYLIDESFILNVLPSSSFLTGYHLVYNSFGERLCFNSENDKRIIVKNPEPWLYNKGYKRISVYPDDNKSIQLIIGVSTIQVWRKKKSISKVLEYIWANKHIEKHKQFQIQRLKIGYNGFYLKLNLPSGNSPSQLGNEIEFEWPEKVNPPVDACQTLEFLEKIRSESTDLKKQLQIENLIQQTESIIKKCFFKKCGLWRLLDIRFDIMASLIRGNRVSIIRKILSSKDNDKKSKYLHIPRCYSWNKQIKETDLEIAIKYTNGNHRKDTIITKYLLDYYSDNAVKTPNWMFTVVKGIPLLYEYRLVFYVKELFQKPCFGSNEVCLEHFSNKVIKDIIKKNNKNIHAIKVDTSLSKRENGGNFLRKLLFQSKQRMFSNITRTKSVSTPNQIYMVPLPDFTLYPEGIDDKRKGCWMIFLKFLKLLFWPRGHVIKKEEKMSPFLRMILNENSAEIYDNPSIAAIIDFKWNLARGYYFRQILLYLIFAVNFALIVRAIDGVDSSSILFSIMKSANYENRGLILVFYQIYRIGKIISFYLIGGYLLNTERIQLKYVGWKRYFNFYNFFDLFSVILPLIFLSIYVYLYYQNLIIFISLTILVISFELVLLLRYFEKTGAYIYIITNIVKQIIPFLLFILLFTFGIGFSMHVLLRNVKSEQDNYYTNLLKSIEAVYFWTNGRWDNLDPNNWSIDVFTLIGSILLVIILQNMLIAIMTSAFDDAKEVSRHAVLKFRAEMIADYETIEKLFDKEENPRYIYFSARSDYIERWLKKSEKAREDHKNFSIEGDNGNLCYYGDDVNDGNNSDDNDNDSGDDRKLINSLLQDLSSITSQSGELSSSYWFIDEDSNTSQHGEREIPLSSYWFVDEDEDKSQTSLLTSKIQSNNNQILQDKIDHLIHLLRKHQNIVRLGDY